MKKDVVVLGLGNPLMSDEGVGVFLIEKLAAAAEVYPHAEFIDAGTGGMNVLHLIADAKKAILIDCAFMGMTPGAIKKFSADDVKSVKQLAHASLHEADIVAVIDLARRLGQCPEEIVIFGIEPETVDAGRGLSTAVSGNVDEYLAVIREELDR
jgi:hydrogenase maturation protease